MKEKKRRRADELQELRGLKPEDLKNRTRDLKEQLFWLKFKLEGGKVDSPANIKKTRISIARINSILSEKLSQTTKGEAS